MTRQALLDWTTGQPGIVVYRCHDCGESFYFERSFCPGCGSGKVTASQSPAIGAVAACTLLFRAPTDNLRSYAPYLIVLVALDEGVTVMGHGDPGLVIGQQVRAEFMAFGDRPTIPRFVPHGDSNA